MDKPTIRILICGGRNYAFSVADVNFLNAYLDAYTVVEVVHGGAAGADAEGKEWAEWHGIKTREFTADWKCFGSQAGPLRNTDMADWMRRFHDRGELVLVVAFPGNRGTADMVKKARSRNLPVVIAADAIAAQKGEK